MTNKLACAFALIGTLAACSPKPATNDTPPAAPAAAALTTDATMPAATATATAAITGVGKVAAVDAKAGTIKLDHQPIAALGWPAMSMSFTVTDPVSLADVKVGDAVAFEVKSTSESSVLTKVQKQ